MRSPRFFLIALSLCVAPAFAVAQKQVANSNAITANRLLAHLQLVASDEMEGRDTPSRGLNATAKYIASQLMQWGLKPMGDDGTYFQRIALKAPVVNADQTSATVGGTVFKYGEQFYAAAASGSASGQVVFLPSAYEKPGDANSPYAKIDVVGKIVLAPAGAPAGVSFRDIRSGAVLRPQAAAQSHGAKGLILITGSEDWSRSVTASTAGSNPRPDMGATNAGPALPAIYVQPSSLAGLLSGEPMTADALTKALADNKFGDAFALGSSKTATFTVTATDNTIYTQNVVAEVEGKDPALKSEFVAVGAHYDHLGMRAGGTGDTIYNGADDDGSGTVSILEIAHAFAEGPKPKRSIIFVWHCGEEKGLWGSAYFTAHPTVPITSIVAQLNIDMIGRSKPAGDTKDADKVLTGPNAIYLVGTTRMSSELGAEAKEVNKNMYNLTYDFTYDDLNNPERIFFRSDHYNYAAHGIPILFWFDGVHEDYHRPSDEVAKIDFNKMEMVARTVYATAWDVANRKTRPKVDIPLPAGTR